MSEFVLLPLEVFLIRGDLTEAANLIVMFSC
jgi:hypothetical protein